MELKHSAIQSAVYELVTTTEVDLQLGDDFMPMRFEIFRNTQKKGRFRCRMWEGELHRLRPTFPQKNGKPLHISDAFIFVEWLGGPGMGRYEDFTAPSAVKALQIVIEDFKKFLKHTTGKRARL